MKKMFTKEYEDYIGDMLQKIIENEITDDKYKQTEVVITGETMVSLIHMLSFFWAYAELNLNEKQSIEHLGLASDVAEGLIEDYNISVEFEEPKRVLH